MSKDIKHNTIFDQVIIVRCKNVYIFQKYRLCNLFNVFCTLCKVYSSVLYKVYIGIMRNAEINKLIPMLHLYVL